MTKRSEHITIHNDVKLKKKSYCEKIDENNHLELYELNIIQKRTSKSLLKLKNINDKLQLAFLFVGFFCLPIISWSLGWIVGKIILKPKSHKGKKLRQLNGTLTILCIIAVILFTSTYIQSLGKLIAIENLVIVITKIIKHLQSI